MTGRATAAVLVIGNEVLSGRVRDENLHYLAGELWRLGSRLGRAELCRDDIGEIAASIERLAPAHTWLFTTGGIGPTHDDVTIEGVASAFRVATMVHPVLEELVRSHFGERTTAAHLRMARVPEGASLEGGDPAGWPTVRMRNVYVLPGAPIVLRRKFERLREGFRQPPLYRQSLSFVVDEGTLAPVLGQAARDFPEVEIGSYPERDRVLVTVEGPDAGLVERAAARIEAKSQGETRA